MKASPFAGAALAMAAASMLATEPKWQGLPDRRDDAESPLIPRFHEEIVWPPTVDEIEAGRQRRIRMVEENARHQARIDAARAKRTRRALKKIKGATK